ncbi:nitroreductase family protein [Rhodobium gokarnense]|uniref:Putative NAD(P)H nitroreductase n=1 Tax=Rhodobium gokarnense TaxID=364296 RepID=A0ABT3HDR7_9HYPH|nr:nitroreductase [Rhodobium gokarnense]MCW2308464.1 nitroreductase [Rhodobium gokarnense]
MPDALDLLTTRRSVPAVNLADPAPDAKTLKALLTIASRVPDHGKLSPWRFIIYAGDARAKAGERLAKIVETRDDVVDAERLAHERSRFTRAPLVVGVVSRAAPHEKIPVWEQELAVGAVCMNLLHAAHAYGFAGQWLTEWCAFDADAGKALGLKDGEKFAGFVHIGTPTEKPEDRRRPDIDRLMTYWTGA